MQPSVICIVLGWARGASRAVYVIAERADVLLLCGHITDYGESEEALLFAAALPVLNGILVIAVLENQIMNREKPMRWPTFVSAMESMYCMEPR